MTPAALIEKAHHTVQTCIDGWSWPDGVVITLHEISVEEVMEMDSLVVRVHVAGTPDDDSEDREDLDEMLSALTNHLDTGGRVTATMIGYDR